MVGAPTAPKAAAGMYDRFDIGHFVDPHRKIGVAILLLDADHP